MPEKRLEKTRQAYKETPLTKPDKNDKVADSLGDKEKK